MFAAFHIPDLPMAAAMLQNPELARIPGAILRETPEKEDVKIPLMSLNDAAWLTGIAPGWPLNRALVRCPDLVVIPRDLKTEKALHEELVQFADRFSADIEITAADTVLLDLTGTGRKHFNGLEMLPESEVELSHALAETPDLAHFAVLEPRTRGRFISTGEIGILPISLLGKLDGDPSFLPLLELLGLRTLEDYRSLRRQDLTERFGPVAGRWHDLVSAKTCRLLKLHRPPESFLQSMDFEDPLHSTESLVFVFKRLLHLMAARLAARHLAASLLVIRFTLEEGSLLREIHLPEPLSDPLALLKPIETMVESLRLLSPVVRVELDATSADPLSRQTDWARRHLANPERWADTLARLEALVGNGNVGIPESLDTHAPDSFILKDATKATEPAPWTGPNPESSIPLRRFRPALKIAVAFDPSRKRCFPPLALLGGPYPGPVVDHAGPFITSGDPWSQLGKWHRVEWDVQIESAPLLRVAYQADDRWQIEGVYS
jgi:protein ImuB